MKTVLSMSIACSAASLLGLLGLSLISVAPELEARRLAAMLLVGILLATWLRLAFWAGARLGESAGSAVPSARLRTAVVTGGMAYLLLILLCSFG